MKKLYKIVLPAIAFSLLSISCVDEFLSTKSPSKESSENVFTTISLTESAVQGIYNSMLSGNFQGNCLLYWQSNTDVEFNGINKDSYKDLAAGGLCNYYGSTLNSQVKWEGFYRTVELANAAIEGIRNSDLMNTHTVVAKTYLGEALVLRSMAYYQLVTFYGDVPFRDGKSLSDLSNVYVGRTDRDVIYASIIEDLQEAVEYLPYLGESKGARTISAPDRITKGYAKGLLARVALGASGWMLRDNNEFTKNESEIERHPAITPLSGFYTGRVNKELRDKYYNIALEQCAEMIGSAANPHKLDPDYENIWKQVCKYEYNSSNEVLYQFAYGMGQTGDVLGNLMGYSTAGGDKWGLRQHGGYCNSTAYYLYSFTKGDKRRDVTLVLPNWTSENKEKLSNDPLSICFGKWRIYWMSDAYLALNRAGVSGRVANGIDWIDMRYSDILLMFAETMNELNDQYSVHPVAGISATEALEKVRERAFGVGAAGVKDYDGSSKESFFNAIVNERAWEFGAEGIRKRDLIRWGMLADKVTEMKLSLSQLMTDNSFTTFDKRFQAGDIPKMIYYRFRDAEFIDTDNLDILSSVNPGGDYLSVSWYTADYKAFAKNGTGLLLCGDGLNADSPDYDQFLSSLGIADDTTEESIRTELAGYYQNIGNKSCNNRYLNPIYHTDISVSRGSLSNTYGY